MTLSKLLALLGASVLLFATLYDCYEEEGRRCLANVQHVMGTSRHSPTCRYPLTVLKKKKKSRFLHTLLLSFFLILVQFSPVKILPTLDLFCSSKDKRFFPFLGYFQLGYALLLSLHLS